MRLGVAPEISSYQFGSLRCTECSTAEMYECNLVSAYMRVAHRSSMSRRTSFDDERNLPPKDRHGMHRSYDHRNRSNNRP